MITLNGQEIPDAKGLNVNELLSREGYPTRMTAVECNGELIPRACYETHRFKDGDCIEVVSFVGGG